MNQIRPTPSLDSRSFATPADPITDDASERRIEMSPKSTRAPYGRPLTMALAAAFAGAAFFTTATSASAEEIAVPESLTLTDVSEWKADGFTIPAGAFDKASWSYAIGTGEPVAIVKAANGETVVKPFEKSLRKPAVTTVQVTATPAASGDTLPDGAGVYDLAFKADKITVVRPKPPTVVAEKATTHSKATVPYIKGVKWTAKEAGSTGGFGSPKDIVFPDGSSKPVEFKMASGTAKVQFTASNADSLLFSLDNLKEPVATSWTFDVKTVDTPVDVKNLPAVRTVDNPGTKDWAEVTGLEGVQWMIGTKKINANPGQVVKVAPARGATAITVTAKPVPGYVFVEGEGEGATTPAQKDTGVTFTSTTNAAVSASVSGKIVTVNASTAVKSWTFTPTGGKALKITLPKGVSEMVFTAPGAGTLRAEPVAGYKLTGGTADGDATTWTVS